ncbi:hypothetical protein C8R43DRAFT_960668 [Mycena crocata]|nr:hypothetical protein C8R43DRAFT_960668 [Mycena crocata]
MSNFQKCTCTGEVILLIVLCGNRFLLDTLSTVLVAHALYTYFVINFAENTELNLLIPWSFSTLITFVAQCFYAQAIYNVTTNKTLTYSVGLAALNDLLITAGMCYYLRDSRSGLPSTNQFVDKVILYTISRGILTAYLALFFGSDGLIDRHFSTAQILFLITNVAFPGRTYYLPFHQTVGKLYVNSVLATLNVRKTFQQKTEPQYDTGPGFDFFHAGTGQSLSVEPQLSNINLPNSTAPSIHVDCPGDEQDPSEKSPNLQV